MDFEHSTGGEAAEERIADQRRFDACLSRQRKRFAHRRQRAADHHLVAHLAELPGAGVANRHDPIRIPHRLENRPDGRECGGVPSDHDRERPVDRADVPAADRRIEHRRTQTGGTFCELRADAGAMLLMSIRIVPGLIVVKTPSVPVSTARRPVHPEPS